jgi:thioredoxin 2
VSASAESVKIVPCPQCGRKNRVPSVAGPGTPRCANCSAALPWVTDAGDDTFAKTVETSTVPVLVDLWAPWCGPCRMVSPALETLARDLAGRLKLVKVDVDEAPNVARRFSVQGIPTLVVMKGKDEIARQTGAAPEHALRAWVESALEGARKGTGA